MRKKTSLVFLALLIFLSTTSMAFAAPGNSGTAFDQKVLARFDVDRAMEHLYHLSVNIGPRVAGSVEELETAEYIKSEFERYGYSVDMQEFGISDRLAGHLHTSLGHTAVNVATGSAHTGEEEITAELVFAGLGYPQDYLADAEGKIALVQRGGFTFWEKVVNATNAGAIGVIIFDSNDSLAPFTPSLGGNTATIPVMGIMKSDGEALVQDLQSGSVTASISIQQLTNQISQNVIAVKEATGKKNESPEIVYVTAHYDSVPNSPGASDNASGTAVLLELARILKSYPTDMEIRFAAVGAEEIGLVGSRYYVSQLSEDEISRSVANFNMDMVGTAWEPATALYVNVVDGAPNTVWQYASAAAERLGNDTLVLFQRGASDHVAFYEAGIDAANFIRREPGTHNLEPTYHTPYDTFDTVSADRIQEAGEIIGSAIYALARKDVPRGSGNNNGR